MRRGAPPGERWLQPSDRSLESALVQRIGGGGGGGGTSASASVQEAGEALRRAEAAELLGAAAQAAAVDLRAPRPTVSTVGRERPRTSPRTSPRTPVPRPTPHPTPHPTLQITQQRSHGSSSPLEQLWAGEI